MLLVFLKILNRGELFESVKKYLSENAAPVDVVYEWAGLLLAIFLFLRMATPLVIRTFRGDAAQNAAQLAAKIRMSRPKAT